MTPQTINKPDQTPSTFDLDRTGPAVGEVCLVSTTEHRYFRDPVTIYQTSNTNEIVQTMNDIDARVQSESLYAVGYLAYEASAAFDAALMTRSTCPVPKLWFGLYRDYDTTLPDCADTTVNIPRWTPSISRNEFEHSITRILEYIASGDTYQVNYTFPMYADFSGDPYNWFRHLTRNQLENYCAYINLGSHIIVSASPELFFSLENDRLTTKPMKGTIARGTTTESDRARRAQLQHSQKDRAENIMIVDLLRNDMGRISETGSVSVQSKFDVSKFDTLWQMTSTITSTTHAAIPEIFEALFPPGSVTGAPKIRTSEIIHELETAPRGAYCGAIGWWGPNRKAEFNVSIRTATFDTEHEKLTYSVGAGITWDSSAESEYAECLLKAQVVTQPRPDFELLESILWDNEYFLLERHLSRLRNSAEYFGFNIENSQVLNALEKISNTNCGQPMKVRVLLSRNGDVHAESSPIYAQVTNNVELSDATIDHNNVFLYHKTTNRSIYESPMRDTQADDVILWNIRDEITESTRANVVIMLDGKLLTPPITCGLLAGTYREQLLEEGIIHEQIITKDDLFKAEEVHLINSIRRWIPVQLVPRNERFVHA